MAIDDAYTKALLHMDGADASTTFTDESGKAWTPHNHAQIDTAQSVFGFASGLFDGTDDYLSTADHDDWYLGTGAMTVDFRIRFVGLPSNSFQMVYSQWASDTDEQYFGLFDSSGTKTWKLKLDSTIVLNVGGMTINTNTWYHVALIRTGNDWKVFQDGTQVGSTATNGIAVDDIGAELFLGSHRGGNCVNGWIDEFRWSKGIARWTTTFTPQTYAYGMPPGYPKIRYIN
jgi:hypothetical protein